MNGLIVINKPKDYTSRDVVNVLTKILATKKIGHTGTLDPLASGVLVCLVGRYTKLENLITAYDKEYIAEIKLGIKTDTGDVTGKIMAKENFQVTKEAILNVFNKFIGSYSQQVPKYSAIKIKDKKLYEYARKNIEINLPYRDVTIYSLELLDFHDDIIKFKAKVSKGTYIRSLINDLCLSLNTIGTMQSLVRIKQGDFSLKESYTLEDLKKGNYELKNIKEFLDYPIINLNDEEYFKVANGCAIANNWQIKDKVIFTYHNQDISIYERKDEQLKSFLKL